jgi:Flp pilus assembly protein TadG
MSTYFGGTMNRLNNNQGSVIVFVTLIITLLLVMVGIGLDTGMLTYVRSQAQPAVDAAALAAASGLLGGQTEVEARVAAYNSTNNYVGQSGSPLGASNVTPILYDGSSIQAATYGTANGVRVGLEKAGTSPYTANTESSVVSPLFLTPLLNLMGFTAPAQANLNITATAVLRGVPELPVALKGCSTGQKILDLQPDPTENACLTSYTMSPSSKPTMVDMIKECAIPPVDVNTWIDMNNGGVMPVFNAIEAEYGPFNGTQCFIVPVISPAATCSGSGTTAPIESFARICINARDKLTMDVRVDSCDVDLVRVATRCSKPVLVRDKASGM